MIKYSIFIFLACLASCAFLESVNGNNRTLMSVDMNIFSSIEDIEAAAIVRNDSKDVEKVAIDENQRLSDKWRIQEVEEFYLHSSGSCSDFDKRIVTCSRDVTVESGKFKVIISFDKSKNHITVVEYVAIGIK